MAQYEYDKQIKQITDFILKLKRDIKDMNIFVIQKLNNEIMKGQLEVVAVKESLLGEIQAIRDEVNSREEVIAIDNQRIENRITELFRPMETKIQIVSDNMSSVFSYIKDIEDKTQNTLLSNNNLINQKDEENKRILQSHKEEIQQYISSTIQKVNEIINYVSDNNVSIKEEALLLVSSISDRLDEFISTNDSFVKEEIGKIKVSLDINTQEIGNINDKITNVVIKEIDKSKEGQKILGEKITENKKNIEKNTKEITKFSSELEKVKKDVKKGIQPGSMRMGGPKGDPGITDPVILLSRQNFYVDTYSASNQMEEGHREDGTTIVNTYTNNLITQSLYTFPDATVITQTISYDGNDRVLTSIFS